MIYDRPILISLCSGALGMDLGLEKAGFLLVSITENNKDCVSTIKHNKPEWEGIVEATDIRDRTGQDLLEEGGRACHLKRSLRKTEIDLIAGGIPCQPFSLASLGKRKAVQDKRGVLYKDFLRIVTEIQPRLFLLENVKGLMNSPGNAFEILLREFEATGYDIKYEILNAADYGVPQKRERLFFVGSRVSKFIFPIPSHNKDDWLSLREGLSNLKDTETSHLPYPEKFLPYWRQIPPGGCWRSLDTDKQKELMGGAYNSGGGRTGFFRRLSWDKPCPTITTSQNQKATGMCHPEEDRPLTIRECARVQGFPDNWEFVGSAKSQYQQIGNAVPVLLAKAIGESMIEQFY
jgi:DNA (cytosine-5)-methyltransferase 1